MKKKREPLASKKGIYALKRRVSPVMGEIILELLYRSQGKKLPPTEIASNQGILLEQVSINSTNEKGWKKSRLPAVDIAQNQGFKAPLYIGRSWKIIPSSFDSLMESGKRRHGSHRRDTVMISAGLGFGSGKHETTQLCLELMEQIPFIGSFLDIGTGSGILALGASKKGFSKIVGIDFDRNALKNARENALLNQISSIQWKFADISKWKPSSSFQVIAANLLSLILLEQTRRLSSWLENGGFLLLSGFFKKDVPEIEKSYSKHQLNIIKHVHRGRWHALLMKKENFLSGNKIH